MTRQFRIVRLALSVALIFAVSTVRAAAQTSGPPPGQGTSPRPPRPPQPQTDQMTNIPYFTLRDGMSSTLTLNNIAPTPTKVTVTIFNTEGQAHVLDPITLDLHSVKEIKLQDVVPPGDFDSGNIQVAYHGISMGVTCQVSVVSADRRVSFESREQDMMDFESSALNGILWLPEAQADGFLAVTNTAKSRVTVQLTVGSNKKDLSLFPRETQVLKLKEELGLHAPVAALIKLQHNGLPGDIITTGYILNLKDGYSSSFAMVDPAIMRSTHLAGAHLRIGKPDPSEGFPAGTQFLSPLLLANVSDKPITAHVSVDYTVQEKAQITPIDPKNAGATQDKFSTAKVKDLTIAPGEVQRIELSDALGGVGQIAEAGVDIAYDAAPGSIIGNLTSVDQTGDYAFEVPVKDPDAMNETMESIYPWTLENGTATVLHLKNTTDKTVEAGVLIRFAGGTYQPDGFELQPYQTIALDIQRLKDSKKPDVLGHTLASDATHGQLAWFQKTPYTMIGRAEGTDVAAGIARSFSCGTACCDNFWVFYDLSPYPMTGYVGGGAGFQVNETKIFCDATSMTYPNVQSQAYSWVSETPSVASVNSAGYTSCLAPGTSNVVASFNNTVYTYDASGTRCLSSTGTYTGAAPVNVNPPDHVKVVNDTQGYPTCASGTPVYVRRMNMQMVDTNNNSVTTNYSNKELPFTNTSTNTCGNGQPTYAVCFTTGPTQFCTTCGPGQFNDTMTVDSGTNFNYCSTINPAILAGNCGYTLTSTWAMCSAGLSNSIWTSTRGTFSQSISVSGQAAGYAPGTIFH